MRKRIKVIEAIYQSTYMKCPHCSGNISIKVVVSEDGRVNSIEMYDPQRKKCRDDSI
ncbi:hypothetical protein LCGC14_0892500 [marine sediment metagenome]|uniref:Uncharacterized protein n=1 Tax=marine sediment metagenome TaxID=412755 RepID=A0A0F9PJH7_9ZZZZ